MKYLLIALLCFNLYALEDRQALMDSISQYSIRIGNGENRVYAFVDPLCPRSQAYIELISSRKDLQEDNSYYIFLYQLSIFESEFLITYIYQNQDPLTALQEIMIYEDYDIEEVDMTPQTLKIIEKIKSVGKQMDIKQRPYLLIFDKGSKYCRVSDGTAPCLEEKDFD